MGRTQVKVSIDRAALNSFLGTTLHRAVQAAAVRSTARARSYITAAGRVEFGRLRDSVTWRPKTLTNRRVEYEVGSWLHYAGYQERGIGPVYPVRAKVLRWRLKGTNVYIFRPRSSGFRGAFYMRDTLRALNPGDFIP